LVFIFSYKSLGNNNIGREGAKSIAEALRFSSTLASLELSITKTKPRKWQDRKRRCNVHFRSIKRQSIINFFIYWYYQPLIIGSNDIGTEGIKCFSEALSENRGLTSLSLSIFIGSSIGDNNINNEGARYIAEALGYNKTLTSLNLGKVRI